MKSSGRDSECGLNTRLLFLMLRISLDKSSTFTVYFNRLLGFHAKHKFAAMIILTVAFIFCGLAAPMNNPLKGFMPYAGSYSTFPYSMEWGYIPLRSLMSGPTNFNWTGLDTLISNVANRGHQTVFRIYLDYPTLPTGIPQYLLDAGLATNSYTDYGNNGISVSPDYENPLLVQALTNFRSEEHTSELQSLRHI